MPNLDARTVPLDPDSAAALAGQRMNYVQVEPQSTAFPYFDQAVRRGFLDQEGTAEQVEDGRSGLEHRRLVGIYDPHSGHPEAPVATTESWIAELTTEPGRTVPMWAISGVTVAATHRRRGIARAMIEGELRAAAAAGLALAGLTVSETTIYGRWGFSPAVFTTNWTIRTARAGWIGPTPAGRLDFVPREDLPALLAGLHDRVRLQRPGEVDGWPGLWRRVAGLRPDAESARKIRAVQYTDEDGTVRGVVVYTLTHSPDDFAGHQLEVQTLLSDGPDAYAALWRFVLEHDLVATVTATLCALDEPLRWMIADQRGATVTQADHHWLRVLDVPAALQARRFASAGTLVLRVTDPLGFADGAWRIAGDPDGEASVTPSDEPVQVTLSVNALSSLLLGGVAAATLRAAGQLVGEDAAVRTLQALFAPQRPPHLSIWY